MCWQPFLFADTTIKCYFCVNVLFMKNRFLFVIALFLFATNISAQESDSAIEIGNKHIRLRQDLTRGGAICYLSRADENRNLVNICDEGRYIQQSYYAGNVINRQADGQCPTWSPWAWNPIQVGDYARNRAQILECEQNGKTSYVKCIPMLWDMNNHPAEATMEQWTTIRGNVIHVKNRLSCHRTDDIYGEGRECDQEIPAVYLISALKNLHSYFGDAPFTDAPVEQTEVKQIIIGDPEHFWGQYPTVTEQWMAFTDDNNWGVAVYSPSATSFLAGRFDDNLEGDAMSAATSYIAPLRRETMMKNSTVEYEYYLIVGTIEQIRNQIYKIKRKGEK